MSRASHVALASSLALLAWSAPAHADEPLSLAYDFTSNADFFATGAAMAIDGPDGDSDVDTLLHPATTEISAEDIAGDVALRDAFLYWGGSIPDGDECSNPDLIDNTVTFTPPGGAPSEVLADQCYCSDAGAGSYDVQLCRARVTDLLGSPVGEYAVDDFDALIENGGTNNASFSVVLIYSAPELPLRRIALYDGLLTMWNQGTNEETVVLDGIEIDNPPSGDLTWYALEGDIAGADVESVDVTGSPGGLNLLLQDQLNPADNPMNHTINTTTPPQTDSIGVDIDQFDISAALTAGDTSVETVYRGGFDKYWIAYNIVGVNIFAPLFSLSSSKDWALADDVDQDGVPSPGDVIRYTVHLQNDGDAPGNVMLEDPMPPEVESWELVESGGGVDNSTPDTLILSDLVIEPDASTDVIFDVVIAPGTEGLDMINIATWTALPDDGAGDLEAPPVPIADDMPGDGDGDPAGDGDGDPAGDGDGDTDTDTDTTDSGTGSDSGDTDTDTDTDGSSESGGDTFGGGPGVDDEGCNCATDDRQRPALPVLLGLLGLLGLRRRR